jgi:hypothetical protein
LEIVMGDRGRRYCVVTPYFKEDRAMLKRCMDSVRDQTVGVDHILVADGFPQDWISAETVRHVILDQPHADYGDVARGVGALLAVAEKYDAITFLDADNWYDDDHVECCLTAAQSTPGSAFVAAQRKFVRADGSVMAPVRPAEVPHAEHIDTNCYFFLPKSYHFLHYWCTIPQELSPSGDHLFYLLLKLNSVNLGVVPKPTVNYFCNFEHIYREIGEQPPPGAKPILNWKNQQAWINSLSPDELGLVRSLTGLGLVQDAGG